MSRTSSSVDRLLAAGGAKYPDTQARLAFSGPGGSLIAALTFSICDSRLDPGEHLARGLLMRANQHGRPAWVPHPDRRTLELSLPRERRQQLRPSVVNRDDPRTPRPTRRREPRGDAAVGPGAPAYAWGRPLHREGRAPGLVLGRANGHLSSVRVDGVERATTRRSLSFMFRRSRGTPT
jgi:hypothetical protein